MKKTLIITISLMLLFLNIPVIANAASNTTTPTIKQSKIVVNHTKQDTANSHVNVIFNSNGGSAVASLSVKYNGKAIAPSRMTKTGYTFVGWYKDNKTFAHLFNFRNTVITENITIFAKWKVTAPPFPTGNIAKSSGYNSIKVSFRGTTGANGYEVYRAAVSKGAYTLISRSTATSYNNTGLTTNKIYYYKVRAYKLAGGVRLYSGCSTTISSKPILVLPTNAKASRVNSKSIKVTWSISQGANGYEVYRSASSNGTYSLLSRTKNVYYTNSGLTTGKAYYYKVRSYRTVGKTRVYSTWRAAVSKISTKIVYNNLVKPNAVYGKYVGSKVEIKDERNNRYLIRKSNGAQIWVARSRVSVPSNPATNKKYLSKKQLETYVNGTSNFVSNTNYFTWVDLNRQRVNIFTGSAGHWVLLKSYSCATGNNKTPSKRGLFTIQDKGYSFSAGSGVIVKYWTRYSGSYMLHSILVTPSGRVVDGTLGKRVSHGCIRIPVDMAKWVYDKMPRGSLIWVN